MRPGGFRDPSGRKFPHGTIRAWRSRERWLLDWMSAANRLCSDGVFDYTYDEEGAYRAASLPMVTVTLERSDKPNSRVSVRLDVATAKELSIKSLLSQASPALFSLAGVPYASYQAVEAACLSGIAYGCRALRTREVNAELVDVSGVCDPGDVEGFAFAATIALAIGLGRSLELDETFLGPWVVV